MSFTNSNNQIAYEFFKLIPNRKILCRAFFLNQIEKKNDKTNLII